MRRHSVIVIALTVVILVSIALAALIVTYNVTITPTVVKSPVEFEHGADNVSLIDNVNKTKATIQAMIIPLVKWVSEDSLHIKNVNNTKLQVKLYLQSISDPSYVIKSTKIYLTINATEYLAIEIGENGTIIKGESSWHTMQINATFKVKVITEGRDGAIEGTQALVVLGLEVREPI